MKRLIAKESKFYHWDKWGGLIYPILGVIVLLFAFNGLDGSGWWEDLTGFVALMVGLGGMVVTGAGFLALFYYAYFSEESNNEHGGSIILCAIGFVVFLFIFFIGYDNHCGVAGCWQ